jgi:hypothetical protein
MQFLKQSKALLNDKGLNNSQEMFSVIVQSLCSKLMMILESLVVLIQKVSSILPRSPTNIQQHNWYLSTEATSFTHRKSKP